MLPKEHVLGWCEIEHALYEENGHVFGVVLDLFNNHKYFYHMKNGQYTDLIDRDEDIYDAIDKFNAIVAEDQLYKSENGGRLIDRVDGEFLTKLHFVDEEWTKNENHLQ